MGELCRFQGGGLSTAIHLTQVPSIPLQIKSQGSMQLFKRGEQEGKMTNGPVLKYLFICRNILLKIKLYGKKRKKESCEIL